MESEGLREFASDDQPKKRHLPSWLKIILLVIGVGIVLNAGVVALARLDSKSASRQADALSKALGAWQAPVDYQFTGQGWIVGGTGKTWVVSGVPVRLSDNTQIIGDLHASDGVILSGRILESGIWLADRIEPADIQGAVFTYNGTLEAIESAVWRVGGLDLVVDESTQITGTMAVDDLVLASFIPAADGSRHASKIEPFDQPWVEPTPLPTATAAPQPAISDSPQQRSSPAVPKQKKSKNQGAVTICHNPGKKGGHTMTVNGPALESHLRHGDTRGPCR